ncbi:hypothetical protein Tco_0216244 [Tanacetum coccineum]
MTTLVDKRNNNKFCEFHGEVGQNTDECMHLKIQIKELIKAGKLTHVIKELKQGSEKDHPKSTKKEEASGKDKAMKILMVQPWQRVARQRITQSFSSNPEISFLTLREEDGDEAPMVIEAEIGGHFIHRLYVTISIRWDHRETRSQKNPSSPATAHEMLKFPVPRGILTLWSSRIIPLECTMVSGPEVQPSDISRAAEERIKVAIHPEYPEQTIAIGSTLTEEGRKELSDLLRHNLNIFAWKLADMTGVPRHVAEDRLNV